MLQEASM
jgi:hypothetical protein